MILVFQSYLTTFHPHFCFALRRLSISQFLPFSLAVPSFIMFAVTICAAVTRWGISNSSFNLISQSVALSGTGAVPPRSFQLSPRNMFERKRRVTDRGQAN